MNENVHALTGAYVLDALDADERRAFEAHLRSCQECRDEVASLEATVLRMALADAVTPPPSMRDAVAALIARGPQVGPDQVVEPLTATAVPAVRTASTAGAGSRPRRRPPTWRRWPMLAAAASLVVLGVAGGSALYRSQQATLLAEATQATVMRIVSAPDAISHDLGLGAAHVVLSAEMSAAAVMGQDVPMPDQDDLVYQVWMMHADGSAGPGPTFLPHDGEVTAVVEGDFGAVTELTITLEPRGGSSSPTGPMVAHITL